MGGVIVKCSGASITSQAIGWRSDYVQFCGPPSLSEAATLRSGFLAKGFS